MTMVIEIPVHIMNACMYCDLGKNGVSKTLLSLSCREKKWGAEELSSWLKVNWLGQSLASGGCLIPKLRSE